MNPFIERLKPEQGPAPLGTFLMSASPLVAEAMGCSGFEWAIIDAEHAPIDVADVAHLLQAIGNTAMLPVVRAPWNEPVVVKRLLDAGAPTLLFPFIQNADDARSAVAATRYPPEGIRGMAGLSRASRFGARPNHFRTANASIGVVVQIETPQAVEQLEAIAGVPGVDALFVGPTDLSGGMGLYGDASHARVREVVADVARRCKALGKPVGTLAPTTQAALQCADQGFDFVVLSSDLGMMLAQARAAKAEWDKQLGGGDAVSGRPVRAPG
ncbi:HpcH/HpaI aldolase/citrate lyase family protein [Bordetella sp. BOR01]|uniref:HpcH/HpaI aldolase family protein n=1 Tax=Bordetella sp. BOR01 TaxID=2854779 RepID=UPI001C474E3C|nr:aldolase/citrate lyase family protein [Bordetella sp. BOR01]MBV7482627.1 2-dehydro-3-deoxyglucarate aldolase [Bordetella sp. BOR01]